MDEAGIAGRQRLDLVALEHHLQRVAGLHQARDALGAACAGEQAELLILLPQRGDADDAGVAVALQLHGQRLLDALGGPGGRGDINHDPKHRRLP